MNGPTDGARELSASALRNGFLPEALHTFEDESGEPLYWRIRLRHPDTGEKWMRPMHFNGTAFVIGEPPAPADGRPLYRLPELIEADKAAPVFVVEGEKCADALAKLGVIVTTSGGATSASGADWRPLEGRAVIVWPDHDDAGAKYADAVAARLRALGTPCGVIDVQGMALPAKGDCVDWLAMKPEATAADLLALPTVMDAEDKRTAPEPLRRPMPPAEPYPLDALGGLLGDAAKSIHRVVQAPAAMCGQSILSAASLAVQPFADVLIDGRREPLGLWHVTVGDSGERKSAADGWALSPIRAHEMKLREVWEVEMAAYRVELSAYNAALRTAEKGKKDAEGVRGAIREIGPPPELPLNYVTLVPEATMEGLHKLYQCGRPSLGLFNDDAGDFLDGHAMSRDNRTKSAAGFSKLWDNGEFSRIRAGDGASKHYGKRLAMHVMVQPVIAERVLSDDVLCGQGFLPRCLIAWPDSTVGTRRYVEESLDRDPAVVAYRLRMAQLLDKPATLREGCRNDLDPRPLALSREAKARWMEIANSIELDMAGDFASVRAWASKGAAQVLRVAGVLTLVEQPEATTIGLDAIDRAAMLVSYHLHEAVRVIGTSHVPPKVRHAEMIQAWCWESGREFVCSRDALRLGPNPIRTNEAFSAAMAELERTGWAAMIEGGMEIDGRRQRRVWQLQPRDAA